MSTSSSTRLRLGVLVAAVSVGLVGCGNDSQPGSSTSLWPEAREAVRSVRPQPDVPELRFPGWLRGSKAFDLAPFEPTQVKQLHVEEGQAVAAGTLLATLYAPAALEAVAQAEAKVAESNAEVSLAEANVSRQRPLAERQLIARQAFDETIRNAELARQRLRDARAKLASAQIRISDTQLVAPEQGVVARIYRREGSFAGVGDSVLRFEGIGEIIGEFRVPERHAQPLRPGQAVIVHGVDKAISVTGRIREVAAPTQQDAGLRVVSVALDGRSEALGGGRAELELEEDAGPLWKVTYQAVQHDPNGKAYVMLRAADPKGMRAITVEVVGMRDQYVVVRGPLTEDDELLLLADGAAAMHAPSKS